MSTVKGRPQDEQGQEARQGKTAQLTAPRSFVVRVDSLQDHHGLVGDTSIRVDLLEHLVDVGRVGLGTLLLALLLVTIGGCRGLFGGLACLSSGGLYE